MMSGWVILIIAFAIVTIVEKVCETIVEVKKVREETFKEHLQNQKDQAVMTRKNH